MGKFLSYNPDTKGRVTLVEQLAALEAASGCEAKVNANGEIFITAGYDIYYNLSIEISHDWVVVWMLRGHKRGYSIIDREDLREIKIKEIKSKYKGVEFGGRTYYTDDEDLYIELKQAIAEMETISDKIQRILGK